MTIILFLVDSSASMVQKNYMGFSAIDTAKSIVLDILKQRQRDINNRQTDRYMLFSTEDFPLCVKAGWKEGSGVFHDQLKALRPCGKFPLKTAILSAFHFVNLNRAQTGVDYYGHGRFPHLQEPVILITITDSTGVAELPKDFELRTDPKCAAPGTEYTEEAFRWDQRMFTIVLRMGARTPTEPRRVTTAPPMLEPGVIQRVCDSTGGRSFSMTSHKQQSSIIELLTQMIHNNGIVLRFELGEMPRNGFAENGNSEERKRADQAAENLRKTLEARPITFVITRNRAPGHWPIPESFWPESVQNSAKLPVRKAHPLLTIGEIPAEAMVNTEFPFDKYELDHMCPLAEFVRERTAALGANANICWQVYVKNSNRLPGYGKPFGYLKTATNGSSVNLFLMPYNYPVLLKLLEQQKAEPRARTHPEWRRQLDEYVGACPSYYKQGLKKALARMKLTGGILDEPAVALYVPLLNKALTGMKSVGKEEMDTLIAEIGSRLSKPPRPPSYMVNVERHESIRAGRNFRIEWEEERKAILDAAKAGEPERKKIRSKLPIPAARNNVVVIEDDIPPDPELPEGAPPAVVPIPNMMIDLCTFASTANQIYRNPFSIEKTQLVQMLPRLRVNLEQQIRDSPIPALEGGLPGTSCKLQTAYELHSQQIALMGNYDEYVKALEMIGAGPLREVEHRAVRENTFGNPFKKDKKSMAVDEVGEAPAAARENNNGLSKKDRRAMESNRPPRRKAGPLALNSMQVWRERRRTNSLSTASDMSHTAEDLTDDLNEAEAGTSNNGMEVDEITGDFAQLAPSTSSSSTSNGAKGGGASPASSTTSRDSGVSEWGLDEEAEDEEEDDDVMVIQEDEEQQPPPAKKAKISGADSKAPGPPPPSASPTLPLPTSSSSSSTTSSARQAHRPSTKAGGEEATLERIRSLKAEVASIVRMFLSDDSMLSKIESLLSPLSMQALIIMMKFARDEAKRFKKKSLTSTLAARLLELENVASTNGIL